MRGSQENISLVARFIFHYIVLEVLDFIQKEGMSPMLHAIYYEVFLRAIEPVIRCEICAQVLKRL